MASHVIGALRQGSTTIDGTGSQSLNPGISLWVRGSDGLPYNSVADVNEIKPSLSFETFKIDALLALIGVAGKAITTGWSPLDAYQTEINPLGLRKTTGKKISITSGIIIPTSLSASQGGEAKLGANIVMSTADGSAPYALSDNQTVPADARLAYEFSLGPLTIGSTTLEMVQQISVDFGIEVIVEGGDGSVYPKFCYIRRINPKITATVKTADPIDDYALTGASGAASVTFNKRGPLGVAESGHLTLETPAGHVRVTGASGDHDGEFTSQLEIQPIHDGTNVPLAIAS